ncbi:MAG: chemotaxis protein CheW [Kofleriaceae bacterium]
MSTERSKHSSSESGLAASRSVVFWVGKRCLALPVDSVREVVDLQRLCPVPMSPPGVLGIVSLRGTVLSVLDAGYLLMGSSINTTSAKVLVMVQQHVIVCGLAVHRIHGVVTMPTGELLHSHVASPSPFVLGYHDLQLGDLVEVIDTARLSSHIASLRFDAEDRVASP